MKDLLNRRINSIQSLDDRKIFRDIISQVFMEMADYQERQIQSIRNDFFDEMTVSHTRPIICGTIMRQYEYDETDNFMFPMSMEDIKGFVPSPKDINKTVKEGKSYMIGKTLLKCDYETINEICNSNKLYNGKIYTNEGIKDIKVRLSIYDSYKKIVSHLYSVFIKNGLEWTTPNLPYIHKFVSFMWDSPVEMSKDIVIDRIEIDLEELEKFRLDDVFPVWNMEYTYMQSINFPIATYDNVLKEHKFDVHDVPSYCYIPDFKDEYNGYVKRQSESISVIIPNNEISGWPMYKLHPAVEGKTYIYENQVFDNSPSDNFSNGYYNAGKKVIRTKGEIIRILSSFKVSDMFKIHDCEIISNSNKKSNTYTVNDEIIDEIRVSESLGKTLVVYYDYKHERNYLSDDIISFMMSELQQYIPDMRCIGVVRKEAG